MFLLKRPPPMSCKSPGSGSVLTHRLTFSNPFMQTCNLDVYPDPLLLVVAPLDEPDTHFFGGWGNGSTRRKSTQNMKTPHRKACCAGSNKVLLKAVPKHDCMAAVTTNPSATIPP